MIFSVKQAQKPQNRGYRVDIHVNNSRVYTIFLCFFHCSLYPVRMPTPENQSRQKTERQLVRMQQALEKRMETARDRGHKLLQAIEQQQRHLDEARGKSHDPAAIE